MDLWQTWYLHHSHSKMNRNTKLHSLSIYDGNRWMKKLMRSRFLLRMYRIYYIPNCWISFFQMLFMLKSSKCEFFNFKKLSTLLCGHLKWDKWDDSKDWVVFRREYIHARGNEKWPKTLLNYVYLCNFQFLPYSILRHTMMNFWLSIHNLNPLLQL